MEKSWSPEVFETCEAGVSSAYDPALLQQNSLAWQVNGSVRKGKAGTRMGLTERLVLPIGTAQGIGYFSIQGGMLVTSIAGQLYRIRINSDNFDYEEIPLDFVNSPAQPEVWMEETSGSLIIQDGQSNPIIYNGSTTRRSDVTGLVRKELNGDNVYPEVPLGRMMAYINGRLWVVINDNELVAGDIKTNAEGSELRFTENQYFLGGGAFYFTNKISAISGVPATGAAGYGALVVFGQNSADMLRADITNRDLWQQMPGFIQPILLNTGCAGQGCVAEVNQDLFWRDSEGNVRSIRSSVANEASAGNTPVSEEISRIIDHESDKHLRLGSAIHFGNRYLCTASPFINELGGTSYRKLIALDFSPISSMRGAGMPAYDGEWTGVNFVKLIKGRFGGRERAFALSLDYDGNNRLWEITPQTTKDRYKAYVGTSAYYVDSPVEQTIELPRRSWGNTSALKSLRRCDVFLSSLQETTTLEVYWRKDNQEKWQLWDQVETCARITDTPGPTPHTWKNLRKQGRPQVRTMTLPEVNLDDGTFAHVGFEFQVKLKLTGQGKIHRCVVWTKPEDTATYADRDSTFSDCTQNDVTGNQDEYLIPTNEPPAPVIHAYGFIPVKDSDPQSGSIYYGAGYTTWRLYGAPTSGNVAIVLAEVDLTTPPAVDELVDISAQVNLISGLGDITQIFSTYSNGSTEQNATASDHFVNTITQNALGTNIAYGQTLVLADTSMNIDFLTLIDDGLSVADIDFYAQWAYTSG